MFSKISLATLSALLAVASAATQPNVDVTREVCNGPVCKAYLLTPELDYYDFINKSASSFYLTGVNNPEGGIIDINKIECSYKIKGQNATAEQVFSNKKAAYIATNKAVEIDWVLCEYNAATPGKV